MLRVRGSPPHPLPASWSFSCVPPAGWRHLKTRGLLGAEGPAPPSVERTQGGKWSDLIKAVAAPRAVTRSWGQPEKVVGHLTSFHISLTGMCHVACGRCHGWKELASPQSSGSPVSHQAPLGHQLGPQCGSRGRAHPTPPMALRGTPRCPAGLAEEVSPETRLCSARAHAVRGRRTSQSDNNRQT